MDTIFQKSVIDLLQELAKKIDSPHNDTIKSKDKYNGKYNMTIIETFWILHGEYKNIKGLNSVIDTLTCKAIHNYENVFKENSEAFIDEICDEIFGENLNKYCIEADSYPNNCKIVPLLAEVIKSIKQWKEEYKKCTQYKYAFFKSDTSWDINSIDYKTRFKFSLFPQVYELIKFKRFPIEQRAREAIKAYAKAENWEDKRVQKEIADIENNTTKIKKQSQSLYNKRQLIRDNVMNIFKFDDDSFLNDRKIIDNNHPWIEKILILIEYAIGSSFHYELLIIYLFISKDKSSAEWTKLISNKQEKFISILYSILIHKKKGLRNLFNSCFARSISEINNKFLFYKKPEYDTPLTFFNLSKVFILYQNIITPAVLDINHQNQNYHIYQTRVGNLVRDYIELFEESTMIYPCCNTLLSIPPIKLLDEFGLSIEDAAEIMGVNKSTLYRNIKLGTISKSKYLWFWLAISGCTHDFLNGLTSIPYYGHNSQNNNDKSIMMNPIMSFGIAENMIKNVNSISDYIERLGKNNDLKHTILSKDFQIELTAICNKICLVMRKKRTLIEAEVEKKRNENIQNGLEADAYKADDIKHYMELKSILEQASDAIERSLK